MLAALRLRAIALAADMASRIVKDEDLAADVREVGVCEWGRGGVEEREQEERQGGGRTICHSGMRGRRQRRQRRGEQGRRGEGREHREKSEEHRRALPLTSDSDARLQAYKVADWRAGRWRLKLPRTGSTSWPAHISAATQDLAGEQGARGKGAEARGKAGDKAARAALRGNAAHAASRLSSPQRIAAPALPAVQSAPALHSRSPPPSPAAAANTQPPLATAR